MSQDDVPLGDEEFKDWLRIPDLQRTYDEGLKELQNNADREFDPKDKNNAKVLKKTEELQRDKDHQTMVNYCIYPFWEKGSLRSLGYYLLRTEPLYEDGEHDVDFLIASSEKKIAIFGEAKTSVGDPDKILAQGRVRRSMIISKQKDLNETRIPGITYFEFVFGLPSIPARRLVSSILRKQDSRFIVWEQGGIDNNNQSLSLFVPPGYSEGQLDGLMHTDSELNELLSEVPTSAKCKLFSPKSHPVTKLQVFAWMDQEADLEESKTKETFTIEDVKRFFSGELENFPDDIIEKETKKALEIAVAIGIVKTTGEEGVFKLSFPSSDPEARYENIKDKWVAYSIENDKKEYLIEERLRLQRKLRKMHSDRFPPLV